jgi:hypothetical protein
MKTPLAVTLVVVGGVLIATPILADYLLKSNRQTNIVRLLEKAETSRVNLEREEVGAWYAFGCWLVGSLAIGASVYFSVRAAPHGAMPVPGGPVTTEAV